MLTVRRIVQGDVDYKLRNKNDGPTWSHEHLRQKSRGLLATRNTDDL